MGTRQQYLKRFVIQCVNNPHLFWSHSTQFTGWTAFPSLLPDLDFYLASDKGKHHLPIEGQWIKVGDIKPEHKVDLDDDSKPESREQFNKRRDFIFEHAPVLLASILQSTIGVKEAPEAYSNDPEGQAIYHAEQLYTKLVEKYGD